MKYPKKFQDRLKQAATRHKMGHVNTFAVHLVERGLRSYKGIDAEASLGERLEIVCEHFGYSSVDELTEHLLERGLMAFEEEAVDPEALKARLKGMGYID